jgi:acyl-coenzyme A thioesterase PaaI-like protein
MTGLILPPYAIGLGCLIDRREGDVPVLACDYGPRTAGRPGYWHGGALSGLLEMAAVTAVQAALGINMHRLKPVNVAVQFMRGGVEKRAFAMGRVIRQGRRLVNVTAEAWQDDRAKPLAMAQMHVMIAAASA